MRRLLGAASLAAALAWLFGGGAAAQAPEPPADDYGSGAYGRLRYQDQGVTLLRDETSPGHSFPTEGETNSPIFPGDTLVTGADQRAEVQLAGGSVLRIDEGTEITFLALPGPYGEFQDDTVLQLAQGTLRVAAILGDGGAFRIDTPAATAYVLGDADLRIEVDGDETLVQTRRGVVEVEGGGDAVLLRGGMRCSILEGRPPADPSPFNTFVSDRFDRWVENREAAYVVEGELANPEIYRELPEEIQPYYRELSVHGTWVHTHDYGYVWCPRVAHGWRPYYSGYWAHGPHGYFWVGSEPWGWAPYHYGRWAYVSGIGWGWVPGSVFGGAWVSWSWGPSYVGWCALDYWNRPLFHSHIRIGFYDPHVWTFVAYSDFHHHHHHFRRPGSHRRADEIPDLDEGTIVRQPPRVEPRLLAESAAARQEALREARARRMVLPSSEGERAAQSRAAFVDAERSMKDSLRSSASERRSVGTARPASTEARREAGTARRAPWSRSATTDTTPDGAADSTRDERSDERRMREVYRKIAQPLQPRSEEAESSRESTSSSGTEKADAPRQERPARPTEQAKPERPQPSKPTPRESAGQDRRGSGDGRREASPRPSQPRPTPPAARGGSSPRRNEARPSSSSGARPGARLESQRPQTPVLGDAPRPSSTSVRPSVPAPRQSAPAIRRAPSRPTTAVRPSAPTVNRPSTVARPAPTVNRPSTAARPSSPSRPSGIRSSSAAAPSSRTPAARSAPARTAVSARPSATRSRPAAAARPAPARASSASAPTRSSGNSRGKRR